MLNGVWLASFLGPGGSGGSVLVLRNGKMSGGTTFWKYRGVYAHERGSFKARITVRPREHLGADSFAGVQGEFEVEVAGPVEEDCRIDAVGHLYQTDGAIHMVLARVDW